LPDFGNIDAIGQWAGAHGPLALGVVAFLCGLGVPLPIQILLLAFVGLSQGAFSRIGPAILACFLGALLGESLHYAVGATGGSRLRDRMRGKWRQAWLDAEGLFRRYPDAVVALSRSVLAAIGLPIDWISGSSGFDYLRFAFWSVIGDSVWILASAGVGFWLGENWRQHLDVLPLAVAVITVVAALAYLAGRFIMKRSDKGEQPGAPKLTPELRQGENELASGYTTLRKGLTGNEVLDRHKKYQNG
jgi:undecaprenyl-diphosphatase